MDKLSYHMRNHWITCHVFLCSESNVSNREVFISKCQKCFHDLNFNVCLFSSGSIFSAECICLSCLAWINLVFSFGLRFDVVLVFLHLLPGPVESLCLDEVNRLVHCTRFFFPFWGGRAKKCVDQEFFFSFHIIFQKILILVVVTLEQGWRDQDQGTGRSGRGPARTES